MSPEITNIPPEKKEPFKLNSAGQLARQFLSNPITPIIALFIMLLGVMAVLITPREENPQIDVPSGNVIIIYPGASAQEVENIIVKPLQRKLSEMTGVDHVYGMAMNSMAMVTVAFEVGENKEQSILKLYDRVMQNMDLLPKEVMPPLVKPVDIDEVPIVTLTLASERYSDEELYRVAQRLLDPISSVPNVSVTGIKGGHKRQFNVIVDGQKIAGYNLSLGQVYMALTGGTKAYPVGTFDGDQHSIPVEFDGFIRNAKDVGDLVVAVYGGAPIYLRDVARVEDGVNSQEKHETYFKAGSSSASSYAFGTKKVNQVTIFAAKKRGTNAVVVAEDILKRVDELKAALPSGIELIVTRNDGEKANHAVNELIFHIFISIAIIVLLLVVALGWRESLIVAFTVPLILGITLFIGMLADQTINRITLFALILALGLLVDAAIVVIENIHRHFAMAKEPREIAVIRATNEIGSPTNVATAAVILAFLPMLFVTGMMGPYMRPIPFNVPVAMIASLVIAYIFTPWLAYKYLPHHHDQEPFDLKKTKIYAFYDRHIRPMLRVRRKRYAFMGVVIALFMVSLTLPYFELVLFKMLPSRNTNTFNITIDLPTGSTIAMTREVAQCVETVLAKEPSVKDMETFIATSGIIDFNGLLRGSSMKRGDNIAEIRVNLIDAADRDEQSPQLVSRIRPMIQSCGKATGANIKLVEDPPGPPVLATLVAEVYGGNEEGRLKLAREIESIFRQTEGVVDVDMMADEQIVKYRVVPDKEKAALAGITTEQIAQTLAMALDGTVVSVAHIPDEREQVGIFVRLDKDSRGSLQELNNLTMISPTTGRQVPLGEITKVVPVMRDAMITNKDLREVTMVTGEMDTRGSLYAQLDIFSILKNNEQLSGYQFSYDGNPRLTLQAVDKSTGEHYEIKWGGEWEITFDVFRDLGAAFGVAVVLIYILMVAYYGNFAIPGIVLATVPLTFIGVLFGHFIMNQFVPTYFTATSMIGFIALAGIVVRNALLLVDFTNDLLKAGVGLEDAILEAAATRFKPILLTAMAIILASAVIVLDPVWQGLAVSLIFGVMVSTVLTLVVIPLLYWRHLRRKGVAG
ncbi:MAG: efflux RND transporter permease subunit [Campylobacterales bacterium]